MDYRTAGESHGQALVAFIEGMPAGVTLDIEAANREMARRQGGYGRGGRQAIERDTINVLAGMRRGKTIG
ncbi:MAG: chorismate synthase, partial [Phycisphaerae bacterium]|nr:chorismate synthase [Phycisphaerae bacterium]